MGFFDKLKESLAKTRNSFVEKVEAVFVDRIIDETTMEELEEILIMSDVGTKATAEIMNALRERARNGELRDVTSVKELHKK